MRDNKAYLVKNGREVDILAPSKMSKSKNNVVDPERIIEQYGADTVRWFVLSDSPPERDVEWTSSGADAAFKFLGRIFSICDKIAQMPTSIETDCDEELMQEMHKTIRDVTLGIESFGFNTAIAKLYSFTNTLSKSKASKAAQKEAIVTLAQLMSPMTPHLAEEIWQRQGCAGLIVNANWPVVDESKLIENKITLPVQVNGKRRAEITIAKSLETYEIEKLALAEEAVVKALEGATPKKIVIVPGRIVNVVA